MIRPVLTQQDNRVVLTTSEYAMYLHNLPHMCKHTATHSQSDQNDGFIPVTYYAKVRLFCHIADFDNFLTLTLEFDS